MKQEPIARKEVVVIGAGLTGLTTAFYLRERGKDVLVLEKESRTGGQIRTYAEEGFVFESGPNTGVVSDPEVAELFDALRPDAQLLEARKEAEIRYIWKGNKFHRLPSGLAGGITTPLFSFADKLRILGEPFRKKGADPDESVGALAKRRLGKTFLEYAVDPFISGIYAGDPMRLTTRYALPKLYALEAQYGGFIRGAIAKSKEPKTDRDRLATKKVFSATGGLSNLTDALAKRIGTDRIGLDAQNIRINPDENGWKISYTTSGGNQTIRAEKIVSTIGAYGLPSLLPFIDKKEMERISNLEYAPVVQISVGIKDIGKTRINGFGALVPGCEKKDILGILFPSSCFEKRAPEKGVLLSFFLGGVKHKELLDHPNHQLENIIQRDLHEMLKISANIRPSLLHIFRHPLAIPQYDQSSGTRFDTIRQLEKQHKGLYLAGNIRDGIGMAHRIRQGTELGKSI